MDAVADEPMLFGSLPSYDRPLSTRLGVGEAELPVDPATVGRFLAKCAPVDDQGHRWWLGAIDGAADRSGGLRSPDEESNAYASELRLGRNFHQEVDHFRYVLPGLFRRGARRQVEARAAKSAWACSMASGYAWALSCPARAR